ncbi:MAG TPA: hypothetical protein VJB57_11000 [Dehalococcoidia bacterium]|nr:hypothetical protein [Dehalococcoidia bacterium]
MKVRLRLLLAAVALVVVALSVQGDLKPKSAAADWPWDNCGQYGAQMSWQWQFLNGYWQLVPVQQPCVQYTYQPQYYYNQYIPYYQSFCSLYFTYNNCGLPVNYSNCGQAFVDIWGNRYTCFGVQYLSFGAQLWRAATP